MLDRQQMLDGLVAERSVLQGELTETQAKFDKLKKRITEVEQILSALDVVIRGLQGSTVLTTINISGDKNDTVAEQDTAKDEQVFQLQPSDDRAKQDRPSYKGTGREHFDELPHEFTKNDVADLLLKYHTELNGTVNENSLRNVVKQFIDLGWARIKVHSVGKAPQIYEKIL